MAEYADLSGNGQGSSLLGKLTFDNDTTKTIAAISGKRVRISDIALTIDALGIITITDGTTPVKFEFTAAGGLVLDRRAENGAFLYTGASGAAVTISASAGNITGFVEYLQR